MNQEESSMSEERPAVETGKPRWTRLATLGFLFATLGPLMLFLAGAAWGLDLGDAAFFVIVSVVLGIVTFLVTRFGTWSKVVGIVVGVLAAGTMFWMVFGLFVPDSFFDFVPGLLFIPGVLIGIGSCIGAIVANRRGHLTERAEGGEAQWIRIAVGAAVVLAVLSGILTFTGRSTVDDAAGAAATLVAKDFDYSPKEVNVPGGSQVLVKNDDPFLHTFTIDELGVDESFAVGSSLLVEIPAEPGTYVFYCKPHSDPNEPDPVDDMAGTITVT
jgi:plastocyanin